jgi:hypothetical protein
VWPGHLAPDNADLGSSDLLLATVYVGDLLAEVEATLTVSGSVLIPDSNTLTYLAALVSSTPSILTRLVLGCVVRRPRW